MSQTTNNISLNCSSPLFYRDFYLHSDKVSNDQIIELIETIDSKKVDNSELYIDNIIFSLKLKTYEDIPTNLMISSHIPELITQKNRTLDTNHLRKLSYELKKLCNNNEVNPKAKHDVVKKWYDLLIRTSMDKYFEETPQLSDTEKSEYRLQYQNCLSESTKNIINLKKSLPVSDDTDASKNENKDKENTHRSKLKNIYEILNRYKNNKNDANNSNKSSDAKDDTTTSNVENDQKLNIGDDSKEDNRNAESGDDVDNRNSYDNNNNTNNTNNTNNSSNNTNDSRNTNDNNNNNSFNFGSSLGGNGSDMLGNMFMSMCSGFLNNGFNNCGFNNNNNSNSTNSNPNNFFEKMTKEFNLKDMLGTMSSGSTTNILDNITGTVASGQVQRLSNIEDKHTKEGRDDLVRSYASVAINVANRMVKMGMSSNAMFYINSLFEMKEYVKDPTVMGGISIRSTFLACVKNMNKNPESKEYKELRKHMKQREIDLIVRTLELYENNEMDKHDDVYLYNNLDGNVVDVLNFIIDKNISTVFSKFIVA